MSAKHVVFTSILIAVVLFVLFTMPAQAETAPASACCRTKAGIVCPQPAQTQTGGSGITPVKRYKG